MIRGTLRLAIVVFVCFAVAGCGEEQVTKERSTTGGGASTQLPGGGETPAEAPNLQSVSNFRPGPNTDDGGPQTLVDYAFEESVYLKGGDRSNFNLVPLDGGDEVPARSREPSADKEGDATVTVLFTGDHNPADYARGFVDTGVVTSRKEGANAQNPLNINQSASLSNDGKTKNPDLVRATYDGGDQVLYEFDEALTKDDIVQNTSGLRVYFPQTDTSTIREAGASNVDRESPTTLRSFFSDDLPGNKKLEQAVGAFVQQGTVQAAKGSRGLNDGKSGFDEILIKGGASRR